MASKADTRIAIVALAKELNVPIMDIEQIDKLEPLEALLKELQDKKAALVAPDVAGSGASVDTGVVDPGVPPPPPAELQPPEPKRVVATTYAVNEGKSVQTKRGLIGAHEPVWAKDFGDSQRDLDHWVAGGYVTKTDHFEQ